jgi:hypothetical protein
MINTRELREEMSKKFANNLAQEHDNLFTGVRFPNETYVSVEKSRKTNFLLTLSLLK